MTLKYATGVMKGRPLDSANMPYRIVERNGEEVALFNNGAMARFYRDPIVSPVLSSEPWPADGRTPVTMMAGNGENDELPDEPPRFIDRIEAPELLTRYPRWMIAKYRPGHKRRWSNPVYAVLEDGRVVYNADRLEVGRGLREFLWLYQKLREFGRGRFQAFMEARSIYFL